MHGSVQSKLGLLGSAKYGTDPVKFLDRIIETGMQLQRAKNVYNEKLCRHLGEVYRQMARFGTE